MARKIRDFNPGSALAYPRELYNVDVLKAGMLDMKSARAEYMRLKSIARKRLVRLESAGFADTSIYKYNKGHYKAQSQLSDSELIYQLSDLARFIGAQTSTVTGQRQYIRTNVEKLTKHGYTGVTEKNFLKFAEYMDAYRSRQIDKVVSSEEIVEMFEKDVTEGESNVQALLDRVQAAIEILTV